MKRIIIFSLSFPTTRVLVGRKRKRRMKRKRRRERRRERGGRRRKQRGYAILTHKN